jgi:hypothetical protein
MPHLLIAERLSRGFSGHAWIDFIRSAEAQGFLNTVKEGYWYFLLNHIDQLFGSSPDVVKLMIMKDFQIHDQRVKARPFVRK